MLPAVEGYRVQPTWRSPLAKARLGTYEWLHEIADKAEPQMRASFLDAIEKVKNAVDMTDLRAALEAGDVNGVMSILGLNELESVLVSAIKPYLENAFIAAGRATPANTPAIPPITGGELAMHFDIVNPQAVAFLRRYNFSLIREVAAETRAAVRRVVSNAVQYGGHPYAQAREIRQFIGLTDRQARSVLNYQQALAEQERAPEQVARMTERYRQKVLNLRAKNIARTETLRASNAGNNAAWQQAADEGLLDRATVRRQWLITPDERLCTQCQAIPLMNAKGVGLGGTFRTPYGPLEAPPAHPQCRCVTILSAL